MQPKKILLLCALCIGLALVGVFIYHYAEPLITIFKDPVAARAWVERRGIWARIIFVIAMSLQVVIAIIPGGPLQVGAGYAFGAWEGMAWCMVAILLGSLSVFLLVKRFGRRVIGIFFDEKKIDDLAILQNPKKLNTLVFILFLVPGTPKDLLTYVIGLTPMPLSTWLVICLFTRIPAVAVSTFGGQALIEKDYATALTLFVGLSIVSVVGYWGYSQWNSRKKG